MLAQKEVQDLIKLWN